MTQPTLRPVGAPDPDEPDPDEPDRDGPHQEGPHQEGAGPERPALSPGPDFRPADRSPTRPDQPAPTATPTRPRPPGNRWRRPGRGRLSLRTRLTVLTAVAVGVAVALAALTSFLVLRSQLYRELDTSLLRSAQATALANSPQGLVEIAAVTSGTTDFKLAVLGPTARGPRVLSSTTQDQAALAALVTGVEESVAEGHASTTLRSARVAGGEYRVAAVQIPNADGSALVFARSLADTQQTLRAFALVLGAIGLGGVVLAGMAGYSVARTGLRPVTDLTTEAERVARTTRLDPLVIPPARRQDEVARLAAAFNRMLGAIAQSRDRERRLVADAGHELRTPLTSMRTNLDLLLQVDRLEAERREADQDRPGTGAAPEPLLPAADRSEMLADLRAQAEELSGLVDDLVQLAREQDDRAVEVDVDLADVVHRAVDRVRRRAPGVAFTTDVEPWSLRGNPALLERAVVNVLDNAAKWSPAGATVAVELQRGVVRVTDAGPGIAPADLPHVFDRFFRADTARSTPGTGLGLSIVRQVVEQHGGSVRAERAPGGGARFFLVLPGAG